MYVTAPVEPLNEDTNVVLDDSAPTSEAVRVTAPVLVLTDDTGAVYVSASAPTSDAVSVTVPVLPFTLSTAPPPETVVHATS